ncbi:aminotransferase [Catellatospora methionotrophica]|uniref:Aminotransferase n=1 Tax=Catellatospora methionotrophica TaxID=121620 RepID=A0A8J3PGW8_9ACTN|nr:PLP-dependent aminotransferase family protein [Catellatospora methionotrophica]GIG16742.1 aminotransferase [Catellatospora methionotrophica]
MSAGPPRLAARAGAAPSSVIRDSLALISRPEIISFAGGLPAPELFDVSGLRECYDRVLADSGPRVLQYSTTDGDPVLREAVAARLSRTGMPTDPGDLLITSGAQQALSLLSTVLLEPGDTVLVEDPTYLAALQCFGYAGARVVAAPTDADGIRTDQLADLVRRERPKLIYLVPTFANPTGHTLPAERRAEVVRVAGRHGVWVVEDDPYHELRFRGEPVPALSSLDDAGGHTILLGSLSKTVAPGMRLGWLRAPAEVHRACLLAKQALDLHTSTIDQAAAAAYLTRYDLDRHLKTVREEYGRRCTAMLDALAAAMPPGSTWTTPDGGMFVWVRLPAGHDAAALLPSAVAHDVAYVPGSPFFAQQPDPRTLRLSFTTHRPAVIAEGIRRLGELLAR